MRSITTAAIIILLLTPENLFTPSLQMSFAACIALISGFAATTRLLKPSGKLKSKIGFYFLSIVISTLLAGTATTPFVIYHFNQFSTYSLITNLFAIPLTNFIIMPLGVASLLLMPIGLDWITLPPMGWAINSMLWIAMKISNLPEAAIHITSYSAAGIGLIALGGVMLCMMATHMRLIGIPIILLGMLTNTQVFRGEDPDLMIDTKGKLFAIKIDNRYYFSSRMSARFVRKGWEQSFGIIDPLTIRDLKNCNSFTCKLTKYNQNLNVLYNGECTLSSCDNLINLTNTQTNCTELVNRNSLKEQGNAFVWITEDGIKIQTVAQTLKRRVWNHFKF
jgi:competence protein ComEC